MSEIIDVVANTSTNSEEWNPEIGEEFLGLLNFLTIPQESKDHLTETSRRILAKCVPPNEASGGRTGLVLGYVQSGKTLSFTGVTALARDNNYPILIVMSGVSVHLSGQSVDRMRRDLRIDGNERTDRSWVQFTNPRSRSDEEAIKRVIENWKDPSVPKSERQTILITVMKHHQHLGNLSTVLSALDLDGIPALIIDDEADQASMNTRAQHAGEESTTYANIMQLCRQLPNYTYLQYTATPQAPLLINLIDTLSPTFTELLSPGPGYVGGKEFFLDNPGQVYTIPESELTDEETQTPPDSLIYAMQIYFLGVAAARIAGEHRSNLNNRTMLIHPSRTTDPHNQFFNWVTAIRNRWMQTLEHDDQDKRDLLDEFKTAYEDLASTVEDIPAYDKLTECLHLTIRDTLQVRVNSRNTDRRTPIIDWKQNFSYILIGGQAMDRGYTVAGLTVTYMSRGIGIGNADTLQQRGRFFGYKEKYFGFCRIFLDLVNRHAFSEYIDLEEDIRRQLKEYSDSGKPLSEWKRAFLIADFLNPTRRNVLRDPYIRGNFNNRWYTPDIPYGSAESDAKNRQLVDEYIKTQSFQQDEEHTSWPANQRHMRAENISLKQIYEDLLTRFLVTNGNDSNQYIGLLLQLKKCIDENPDETCSLYIMSKESSTAAWQTRERTLAANGRIPELFQGRNPSGSYPGDTSFGDRNNVIIQLYSLRLKSSDGTVVADNIRTLAIRVPGRMSQSWLVQ